MFQIGSIATVHLNTMHDYSLTLIFLAIKAFFQRINFDQLFFMIIHKTELIHS